MPIIQRPYVPPEDQVPHEDQYVNPGDTQQAEGSSGDAITFYSDSMHIFSSLYSAVLFLASNWKNASRFCGQGLRSALRC